MEQNLVVHLAIDDLLANLGDAFGTKRIGLARPAQRRLRLLITLQQRLIGPLRRERRVLLNLIQRIKNLPGGISADCYRFFKILDWFMHADLSEFGILPKNPRGMLPRPPQYRGHLSR